MKRKFEENTEINADAVLDSIANLVGILTILFVVVAGHSKHSAKASAQSEMTVKNEEAIKKGMEDIKEVQRDLMRQAQMLQHQEMEIVRRNTERQRLLIELAQAKEQQSETEEKLTEEEKENLSTDLELTELQKKIASLISQQGDGNAPVEAITLQHLPTPMAKTVFNEEVHLLLESNRVSVIPWDRLVDGLKKQAEMQAARVLRSNRLVDSLGPVDGFLMKYALKTERGLVANGPSMAMAQRVELEYFVLEPTNDVLREDITQALDTGGRLRAELSFRKPRSTTITVWVYDNSFAAFRELKERLFVEGYLTAARPLPKGIRIGASPNGTTSSAQ